MINATLLQANALAIPLPDRSVHCVVTSPPYWSLRDYGVDGQLGLEPLHDCGGWLTGNNCGECFVCHMRAVFAEVRRVLRDDGTAWVNLGDSYSGSWGNYAPGGIKGEQRERDNARDLALQRAGYLVRRYGELALADEHAIAMEIRSILTERLSAIA